MPTGLSNSSHSKAHVIYFYFFFIVEERMDHKETEDFVEH